jgi:hypothetical protein
LSEGTERKELVVEAASPGVRTLRGMRMSSTAPISDFEIEISDFVAAERRNEWHL